MVLIVNVPSVVGFTLLCALAITIIPAPYRGVHHPGRDVLCADQLWGDVSARAATPTLNSSGKVDIRGYALSGATHGGSVTSRGVFSGISVPSIDDGGLMSLDATHTPFTVLVVNVASKCGYTKRNYEWLNAMEKQFGKSGGGRLRIVAFPSYEFNDQEYQNNDFARGFIRGTMGAAFDVVSVSPTPLHQCNSSTGILYSRMMAEVNIHALS